MAVTSVLGLAHCLGASADVVIVVAVACPFVVVLENHYFDAWCGTLLALVWARTQLHQNWIGDIQVIADEWVRIVRHLVRVVEETLNDGQWGLNTFVPCSFVAWEWVGMASGWQSAAVVASNIWELQGLIDAPCCRVHRIPSNPTLHTVSILNEVDPVTRILGS